jgi:hypothetical protein
MNIETALKILKHFQLWRRGEVDEMVYSPKAIGIALDVVLSEIEKQLKQKP